MTTVTYLWNCWVLEKELIVHLQVLIENWGKGSISFIVGIKHKSFPQFWLGSVIVVRSKVTRWQVKNCSSILLQVIDCGPMAQASLLCELKKKNKSEILLELVDVL